MTAHSTIAALFLTFTVVNADEKTTNSAIKTLGQGKYSLGLVEFDENSRRISFPAEINQVEGILEFAIVHENGKIHESLLSTKASPLHLNIALKLLHYQESPELFPILDQDFNNTGKYPEVPEKQKTASRLQILISWEKDGKKKEVTLNDLIYHTFSERPMKPAPWIYQGSYIHENTFKAETSGDLAAIFITRSSLINYAGEDNHLDEPWAPNPKTIPPIGTSITITFAPLLEKK